MKIERGVVEKKITKKQKFMCISLCDFVYVDVVQLLGHWIIYTRMVILWWHWGTNVMWYWPTTMSEVCKRTKNYDFLFSHSKGFFVILYTYIMVDQCHQSVTQNYQWKFCYNQQKKYFMWKTIQNAAKICPKQTIIRYYIKKFG